LEIKSGYFPHNENARNDQKIVQLRFRHGAEGYGIYWMLIETMYEDSTGYINRGAIGGLSFGYCVPLETLQKIIDWCVEIGLIEICEHGNYFSRRVIEWKQYRQNCAEFGKQGAEARWKNRGAMQTLIASKESKESKVKKVKKENIDIPRIQFFDFVFLTEPEYYRLETEYGFDATNEAIKFLDEYLSNNQAKQRQYHDHNKVLRNWVFTAVKEKKAKESKSKPKTIWDM